MIKISSRDIQAYIHPSIIKKNDEKRRLLNPTTSSDYTPEKMAILKKMCMEGKIEYYPRNRTDDDSIDLPDCDYVWIDKQGNLGRDNGPSRIISTGSFKEIQWHIKNKEIAVFELEQGKIGIWIVNRSWEFINDNGMGEQVKRYKEKIASEFPKATKIWLWDYFPETSSNPLIIEFRKKYNL